MKFKVMVLAGALSLLVTGMAEAKGWRDYFNFGGNDKPNHSVPEPSTLYALGSAVALLGGAGWFLRRK